MFNMDIMAKMAWFQNRQNVLNVKSTIVSNTVCFEWKFESTALSGAWEIKLVINYTQHGLELL